MQEAGRHLPAYRRGKGAGNFITEVSMDETDSPQTPPELLVILAAIADEEIPIQTIAPKFTGRFNKGVDYVGDLAQFEKEFRHDLAVIAFAVEEIRPAGDAEAERAFGQRQVFDLRPRCAGRWRDLSAAASQDGGHYLAGRTDRPGRSRRRRAWRWPGKLYAGPRERDELCAPTPW